MSFANKNNFLFSGFHSNGNQSSHIILDLSKGYKNQGNEEPLKRFKCDLCPYSTNRKSNMKSHCTVHSGERPYKCETCGQDFARRGQLSRHMLIHTGEKPYSCNVCKKTFNQSSSLKRHMLTHM